MPIHGQQTRNHNDYNNNKEEDTSLFAFYGISTIVGYLMPNPLFIYMIHKHIL